MFRHTHTHIERENKGGNVHARNCGVLSSRRITSALWCRIFATIMELHPPFTVAFIYFYFCGIATLPTPFFSCFVACLIRLMNPADSRNLWNPTIKFTFKSTIKIMLTLWFIYLIIYFLIWPRIKLTLFMEMFAINIFLKIHL